MPFERNTVNNNKPLLPRVATTSSTNVKSPITPRLAAQHLRSTNNPSTLVTSPRPETPRLSAVRSPVVKDDITTPVKSLLNSNITPRSSSRKSRIVESGSNHSTPSATPTHTPVQDVSSRSRISGSSNVTVNQSAHKRPRSVVLDANSTSNAPALSPLIRATTFTATSTSTNGATPELKSSFFHASDAKSQETIAPPPLKKAATFFYANGKQQSPDPLRINRAASPPLSTISTKSHKSQFFHADGRLDNDIPPIPTPPITNPSPEPRPTLARNESSSSMPFGIRPPSPQKSSFHLTYRKGVSQILSPTNRTAAVPSLPAVVQEQNTQKRLSGTEITPPQPTKPHGRAGSLSSIDTSPSSRKSSLGPLDTQIRQNLHARGSPTMSNRMPPPPTSNPLQLDLSQDLRPPTSSSFNSPPSSSFSLPQSPSHKTSQVPAGFAEAAANARRERKVLDLEISNSSLLAINRQLEREVRRQKSELRRFRRLSRAGRLSSFGSVMPDIEDDSGSDNEARKSLSDIEDEYSDLEDDDEEDPDSSMSEESITSSTPSLSSRQVARLAKDEKRLKFDLERHRQLLVDSQKMNQSLKKCMAFTEEMIAEGRRALEYKVRVSDIKLGGRVLDHDDINNVTISDDVSQHIEIPEDHDDDDEPKQRNGLLGTWSPPDSTTPLTAIMNATDGLLGLAVSLNHPEDTDIATADYERDSGVSVNGDIPFKS